jgi:hypothetical protein
MLPPLQELIIPMCREISSLGLGSGTNLMLIERYSSPHVAVKKRDHYCSFSAGSLNEQ